MSSSATPMSCVASPAATTARRAVDVQLAEIPGETLRGLTDDGEGRAAGRVGLARGAHDLVAGPGTTVRLDLSADYCCSGRDAFQHGVELSVSLAEGVLADTSVAAFLWRPWVRDDRGVVEKGELGAIEAGRKNIASVMKWRDHYWYVNTTEQYDS